MFFTEPKSELQIRMQIAEMLKDKVEHINYEQLCDRAYDWITKGVELPKKEKDPLNDLLTETIKKISENIGDSGDLPKPIEKKNPIIELYEKNKGRRVLDSDNNAWYICGYSVDFDCLIGGTDSYIGKADVVSDLDVIEIKHERYRYFHKQDPQILT